MESNPSIPSRIKTFCIYSWLFLFVGLLVAYLVVSFQLKGMETGGIDRVKLGPVAWDGTTPLAAKILAAILIVFLFLIFWPKSRKLASNTMLVIIFFAPLAVGYYQVLLACLAKDLTDYSGYFVNASGALLICMSFICAPLVRLFISSKLAKKRTPASPPQT